MKYLLKNTAGAVIAESAARPIYNQSRLAWATADGLYADPVIELVIEEVHDAVPLTVSPVEFRLLFTAAERVAITAARPSDPVIHDFYTIVEDPRLTHVDLGLQSTCDAIDYLIAQGLVDAARREAILSGALQ